MNDITGWKILVTGAAGFVGSSFCEALLHHKCEVIGLDDFSSGSEINLQACSAHPNFELLRGDVSDPGIVSRAIKDCQAVVHLAAKKIPRYSDGLETLTVNVHGTETLLSAAAKTKARFLFASTSDVYGKKSSASLQRGLRLCDWSKSSYKMELCYFKTF